MKTNALYLLLGMSAGLALCACTDNDVTESASGQLTLTGNKAYMVVNIQDVGSGSTRALAAGNPFEYGTASEYDVKDAHFYFYKENGSYYLEGYNWNGGTGKVTDNVTADDNVEFESNTVVILNGLENNEAPTYVVTVLNKPDGFKPGSTLSEMGTLLASESEVAIMKGDDTYFTMSTTSYVGGDNNYDNARKDNDYFFVTKLTADDFHAEPINDVDAIDDPVEIYVERLAAKVTLDYDNTVNNYESGKGFKISYDGWVSDEGKTAETNYYVQLDGWALDAIAKQSYIVKNIEGTAVWLNESGTEEGYLGTGWTWNDAADHRSYWAKSPNYGDDDVTYPTSAYNENTEANQDADAEAVSTTALNKYLTYVNFTDDNTKELGSDNPAYCGENTNTADILGNKYSTGITNIIVKATIYGIDGNGDLTEAEDLIRYNGVLYTSEDFCSIIIDELNNDETLNAWYKVDDNDYERIDGSYVTIENGVDGYVNIVLKDEDTRRTDGLAETLYYLDDDNEYQVCTNDDESEIQGELDEFNKVSEANGYKDGLMYYSIPIEHLNNNYKDADGEKEELHEANYGVVRNHLYKVTINSLTGLGHGIFDTDEVIVPQNETDKYSIASTINILSWKIVEQSVSL